MLKFASLLSTSKVKLSIKVNKIIKDKVYSSHYVDSEIIIIIIFYTNKKHLFGNQGLNKIQSLEYDLKRYL